MVAEDPARPFEPVADPTSRCRGSSFRNEPANFQTGAEVQEAASGYCMLALAVLTRNSENPFGPVRAASDSKTVRPLKRSDLCALVPQHQVGADWLGDLEVEEGPAAHLPA